MALPSPPPSCYLAGLALNLAVMAVAVELFAIPYLAARIPATGISFIGNHLGQSRITFHGQRPERVKGLLLPMTLPGTGNL